jgi:amidase
MHTKPHDIDSGSDTIFASASEIAAAVRQNKISATAVIEAHLARIASVNPGLNALVTLGAEAALERAQALDRELAYGKVVGPLHGVPISVKDTIEVAGLPCSAGTLGRKAFIPDADATVVARLRAAGAVVLGKGNTPEFACAFETDNLVHGRTNNPYDATRTAGGSSGGDSAIIAAGGTVLAMGTDSGGSARLPAHYCGIAALKPTMNRAPRTGVFPYPMGIRMPLATLSPIARCVDDLILVLPIVSGPDGRDFTVPDAIMRDANAVGPRGLRVAYLTGYDASPTTSEVHSAVRAAATALADAGAELIEVEIPGIEDTYPIWESLFGDGGGGLRALLEKCGSERASPLLQRSFETIFAAKARTADDVYAIAARWDRYRLKMQSFLRNYDALLTPACGFPAPAHGTTFDPENLAGCAYTMLDNLTGWPGCVVRAGTSSEGLPIGVQVTAQYWREDVALALAREVELRTGGFKPPKL